MTNPILTTNVAAGCR